MIRPLAIQVIIGFLSPLIFKYQGLRDQVHLAIIASEVYFRDAQSQKYLFAVRQFHCVLPMISGQDHVHLQSACKNGAPLVGDLAQW